MSEAQPPPDEKETDSERRTANIILLVSAVAVIGLGIWLVNAMLDARQADECMAQGRRDCAHIELPER